MKPGIHPSLHSVMIHFHRITRRALPNSSSVSSSSATTKRSIERMSSSDRQSSINNWDHMVICIPTLFIGWMRLTLIMKPIKYTNPLTLQKRTGWSTSQKEQYNPEDIRVTGLQSLKKGVAYISNDSQINEPFFDFSLKLFAFAGHVRYDSIHYVSRSVPSIRPFDLSPDQLEYIRLCMSKLPREAGSRCMTAPTTTVIANFYVRWYEVCNTGSYQNIQ